MAKYEEVQNRQWMLVGIGELLEQVTVDICKQCGCLFMINESAIWIDRFEYVEGDGHECDCHELKSVEEEL